MTRKRLTLLIALFVSAGITSLWLIARHTTTAPPIPPVGGESFDDLVLLSGHYRQDDPRWASDRLGRSGGNLASHGCTIASVAMGLHGYGIEVTPGELNRWLHENDGYDGNGRLKWAAINRRFPEVAVEWQRPLTHESLDAALRSGELAVVRIALSNGLEHWVLVVGKRDKTYLVRDPLAPYALTHLDSYGSPIMALRVLARR